MSRYIKVKKKGAFLFKTKKYSSLSKLIEKYYTTKRIIEILNSRKENLRADIIKEMEEKGLSSYNDEKFSVELYTMTQTRIDLDKVRKEIPQEQLSLFEFKIELKALKVIPRKEEVDNEIIKRIDKTALPRS